MAKENCIISLQGVNKVYDGNTVVNDFNLDITKGEFVTFLGPSGCGKTTTLRMIAGFETPTSGQILLNGEDITRIPPHKRPINTVFQRYALFPYLNVYDNVAFGLKLKKIPYQKTKKDGTVVTKMRHFTREEIDAKVMRALKIIDLEDLETRDISTLSGGQQQRVAIARAIVNEPEILLLDEPLGALDLKMRKEMQLELKDMHKKLGITFIYVTHDQEEALTMSDTIVVMKSGEIQQVGTPIDIYNEPVSAYVANFIGESNIYNATMVGKLKVKFLNHIFDCVDDFPVNEKVDVVVRPEDVEMTKVTGEAKSDRLTAKIVTKIFKGIHYEYVLEVGKSEIVAQSTKDYGDNSLVYIDFEPENIQIMKKELTKNLYPEAYLDKNNKLIISDASFDVDVSQLLKGSHVDDELYLIAENGKKYDLDDADVIAEIGLGDIEIVDGYDNGNANGVVVSTIYIGDHWQVIVRTEEEEDFVVDTQDTWNEGDLVSVIVKPEKIALTLKGNIDKYEVQ
ncbi:MAG: ATP-binding cassette domain-containing protein [Bacilli bacterium]|nr:ATP-binding cassette domain-containing protein [Bacilli bacterium]